MKNFAFFLVLTSSLAALAADTHDCNGLDSIGNLVGQTKTIDNVKVAYISTEEPAVAPDHLLVFIYGSEMSQSCTAISRDKVGNGFGFVKIDSLKSVSYDAKEGRTFEVTVGEPDPTGMGEPKPIQIRFRTNSVTRQVSILK